VVTFKGGRSSLTSARPARPNSLSGESRSRTSAAGSGIRRRWPSSTTCRSAARAMPLPPPRSWRLISATWSRR